jgi:hypothetical protein
LRLGTLVPVNTEVPTKYQLNHDDRIVVYDNRLHSKSPMPYRPALHGNWNALSLTRRAFKDKFPTPTGTHSCVTKSSGISAASCTTQCSSINSSTRILTVGSSGFIVPHTQTHTVWKSCHLSHFTPHIKFHQQIFLPQKSPGNSSRCCNC